MAEVTVEQKRMRGMRRTQILIILLLLLIAFVGGTATFAWFTNNAQVNTNSVAVHSGTDELVVEMSTDASSWSTADTVSLANSGSSAEDMTLYPVSTIDLDSFVECTEFDDDGQAVKFAEAEDGVSYYHGYVYVRARMTGTASHAGTVALYLSEALKTTDDSSDLLKAARVGIKFSKDDATESAHYFQLDSTAGTHQADHPTTAPTALPSYQAGQLLGWSDGKLVAGEDASEDYTDFLISSSSTTRPEKSLVTLELNTTYRMDVYYYIEGCDLDSSNYLYKSAGLLHVNLYAILDSQGA